MSWMEFRRRIDALKEIKRSSHFEVHFNQRNPKRNIGAGIAGVRSPALISCYIDALERLYSTIARPPFGWPEPVSNGRRIPVYVFESSDLTQYQGEPFTDLDANLLPFIGLPSRSDQPTVHAEHQYAATCAVHEATHVFNHMLRPMQESEPWRWFDEATAVFMESYVYAGNHDHLRFGMNWSDSPELSLNNPTHHYAGGVFVQYLAKSLGLSFLSEVWTHSDRKLSALEAIADCVKKHGKRFGSDDPANIDDLFNQYCVDSYFLWDIASTGFLPELYVRYGERAITESFRLERGKRLATGKYQLDHLACRYFLFQLWDDASRVKATIKSFSPDGRSFLKASLALVNEDMSREMTYALQPAGNGESNIVTLAAGPEAVNPSELDHLVLVVANCGYYSPQMLRRPNIDGLEFSIELAAE